MFCFQSKQCCRLFTSFRVEIYVVKCLCLCKRHLQGFIKLSITEKKKHLQLISCMHSFQKLSQFLWYSWWAGWTFITDYITVPLLYVTFPWQFTGAYLSSPFYFSNPWGWNSGQCFLEISYRIHWHPPDFATKQCKLARFHFQVIPLLVMWLNWDEHLVSLCHIQSTNPLALSTMSKSEGTSIFVLLKHPQPVHWRKEKLFFLSILSLNRTVHYKCYLWYFSFLAH